MFWKPWTCLGPFKERDHAPVVSASLDVGSSPEGHGQVSVHAALTPCPFRLPRPRSADTIRKMKSDFRKMEDEMDRLATNMAVITDFSARISATLQDRHERITKLGGVPGLRRPQRVPWGLRLGAYITSSPSPRGPRTPAEAAVPLRAAVTPHQVCGAGRLWAGGALPGQSAGCAAPVPAPALLPCHPG